MKKIFLVAVIVLSLIVAQIPWVAAYQGETPLVDQNFDNFAAFEQGQTERALTQNEMNMFSLSTGTWPELNGTAIKIVEHNGGKALKLMNTTSAYEFNFPLNYTPNDDQFIIVEYDASFVGHQATDYFSFQSNRFGFIGYFIFQSVQGSVPSQTQILTPRSISTDYLGGSLPAVSRALDWNIAAGSLYADNKVLVRQKYDIMAKTVSTQFTATTGGVLGSPISPAERNFMNYTTYPYVNVLRFGSNAVASIPAGKEQSVILDNIKVYAVNKMKVSNVPFDGASKVSVNAPVTASFTNNVSDASGILIKAAGQTVSPDLYNVDIEGKTVTIRFKDKMEFDTLYTVDYSAVKDDYIGGAQLVSGEAVYSFTTENAPEVVITNARSVKGIGAEAVGIAGLVADGSLQNLEITVKNTTGSQKDSMILIVFYSSEHQLEEISTLSTSLSAGQSKVLAYGSKISNGGYAKVFSWNSLGIMTPYEKAVTRDISAE